MGPPKFFDVSLPACHSLWTPADLPHPYLYRMVRVGFGHVKTLAVRNKLISKLYQLSGYAVTPTAYRILCLRFAHLLFAASTPLLRNGRKTRYGRVVSPYPAGTLTQQDTPSLSWREPR